MRISGLEFRRVLFRSVWPVKTNSAFLIRALDHPDFVAGRVDTGLIGRDGDAMAAGPEPSPQALTNAAMAMVPRSLQAGFRLNAPDVRTAPFLLDGKRVESELPGPRSEEHTSELQSLLRLSYAD